MLNPYWLLKLCRSPFFYMLNMHKEGRNEQPSDDNESLIRRFIFASIPTQACKTHLWNEMIYYQSLGKCCPISRCSFGISGSPASQQRDTLVHTVLHFKLQNCLTAGTFQSSKREKAMEQIKHFVEMASLEMFSTGFLEFFLKRKIIGSKFSFKVFII